MQTQALSMVALRMAGVELGLELPTVLAEWVKRRWSAFVMPQPTARVIVAAEGRLGLPANAVGQSSLPQVSMGTGGGVRVEGEGWSAVREGALASWTMKGQVNESALASMVQLCLADAISQKGGFLLHSVAIATPQGAAVFTGPSGAGKSTLGQNSEAGGATLIADELVAIVPENGGFTAHGTPWNRGSPRSAPLRALCLLGWGPTHRLEEVAASEVLRTVLPNSLILDTGPEARQTLFERTASILKTLPLGRWVFAPDASVASALTDALGSLR